MKTEQIIQLIEREQAKLLIPDGPRRGEIADPTTVGKAIVTIRMFLVQLVDQVADAELEFRRAKAARYDSLLKEGVKRSPAIETLKFDQDLIEMEVNTERVRSYMKYCDSLVSAVQSLLKVQSSGERNQF